MPTTRILLTSFITLLFCFNTASGKSPVWKISKNDNYFFLGGTIHLLSEGDYPLPKAFEIAFSSADELFFETDMTKSQINKPLVGEPNESWNYSSGTTNLLSGILRQKYTTHQEYLDAWYSDFIDKIGMHSMVVEADLAGNYVGSSYAWANTRDWAK